MAGGNQCPQWLLMMPTDGIPMLNYVTFDTVINSVDKQSLILHLPSHCFILINHSRQNE
jgi:hypothetical protein